MPRLGTQQKAACLTAAGLKCVKTVLLNGSIRITLYAKMAQQQHTRLHSNASTVCIGEALA